MPVGNPICFTDLFGTEWTFWTDGVGVYFSTNLDPTPTLAFNQEVADSPIDAGVDRTGKITVTYLDSDGLRVPISSFDDGETWS